MAQRRTANWLVIAEITAVEIFKKLLPHQGHDRILHFGTPLKQGGSKEDVFWGMGSGAELMVLPPHEPQSVPENLLGWYPELG